MKKYIDSIPVGNKESFWKVIPKSWEIKTLNSVCDFLDSQRIPIKDIDRAKISGIYPYYGASGIIDYVNKYIFDDDLILLAEDGANIINRSTPIAFLVNGKIWVNNHAHVLKVRPNTDRYYLCAYLESLKYDKYNTGTAQPKLNRETCEKIPVLVPPLPEQRKIADILNTWDKAIEKQTQLIEKLELRKKGLMQQLFTAKRRLSGFSTTWEVCVMQQLFTPITVVNDGKPHLPMTISAKLGLISQQNKFDKVIAGDSLKKYTLIQYGDFAYNKGNSNLYEMGCIYQLKEKSALVPFVYICFRAKESVCGDFYQQYFLNHGLDRQLKRIITSGARGDGLLNVDKKDFFSLKVIYPSLEEQTAIAQVLTASDHEIKLAQQKLDLFCQQKRGLMQQLLTGKKRIKY